MLDPGAPHGSLDLSSLVEQAADASVFLQLLATAAQRAVPGADAATLTLEQHHRDRTVASSGDLAPAGDERRYGLDDGPSTTALREGTVVATTDMAAETRWGWYPVLASRAGIGSAMCVPLHVPHPVSAVLTLYSGLAHALGEADLAAARSWSAQASAALVIARWIHEYDAKVQQLHHGLRSNQLIGQATGLLMAQVDCTSTVAFQALRKQSSTSNTKLRTIAEHLVDDHDSGVRDRDVAPQPAPPELALRPMASGQAVGSHRCADSS